MGEHELAKIARSSTLLERLKVDKVANDLAAPDMARILLAYLGATFTSSLKQNGTNIVHNSINDICSMILQDDDLTVVENGSHEVKWIFHHTRILKQAYIHPENVKPP